MSTERRTAGVYSRKRLLGPNGERICYNCGGPLPKGRPYNCSANCSEEWRAKTSPSYLRVVIHERDHGVCALCGLDTDALKNEYAGWLEANKRGPEWNTKKDEWLKAHGIPWGRAYGDWWDADHITPVIEGGGECGLENYRTLCIPCHQKVTRELRGRMARQARQQKADERLEAARQAGYRVKILEAAGPDRRGPAAQTLDLFG